MNNAIKIAVRLEAAGIEIKEVSECTEMVDGAVYTANELCIVVSSNGQYVYVTTETEPGVFKHSTERAFDDTDGPLQDIKQA